MKHLVNFKTGPFLYDKPVQYWQVGISRTLKNTIHESIIKLYLPGTAPSIIFCNRPPPYSERLLKAKPETLFFHMFLFGDRTEHNEVPIEFLADFRYTLPL